MTDNPSAHFTAKTTHPSLDQVEGGAASETATTDKHIVFHDKIKTKNKKTLAHWVPMLLRITKSSTD